MKPTLLFYGNCQAAALCTILAADPAINTKFNVRHISNFESRNPDAETITEETVAASVVFFNQHSDNPFTKTDLLGPDCVRVTFPSVDLNLLWPLDCVNIFNDPATSSFPWGHFPYGDRVVVDRVKGGASSLEVLAYYMKFSRDHLPNLDRFESLEYARLKARDAKCDVTIADFVMERYRCENLFWCVNHPAAATLSEIGQRLVKAIDCRSTALSSVQVDKIVKTLPPEGPLGFIRVPIHPTVAEHFQLRWNPRDDGPYFGLRENRLSYHDYFAGMINVAVMVREDSLNAAAEAAERPTERGRDAIANWKTDMR